MPIIEGPSFKDKAFITLTIESDRESSYKMGMKTFIFTLLMICGGAFGSEVQMLEGEEAYRLYLSLPGVRCTEWSSPEQVVYTKYSTNSCEDQGEASLWTCTIQINRVKSPKKNPKDSNDKYVSASCSREVL